MVDHAVAGPRALPMLAFVDHHLFAAAAGLFAKRQFDQPVLDGRHADHKRPVDLARRAARKMLRELRRAPRGARDQQHAAGILVEPVDQSRARIALLRQRIEQPVDMFERTAAALRRQARRLVEHEGAGGGADHHVERQLALFGGEGLALTLALDRRGITAGGDAHDLPGYDPVGRIGALAVNADLPGARPAADRGEAD